MYFPFGSSKTPTPSFRKLKTPIPFSLWRHGHGFESHQLHEHIKLKEMNFESENSMTIEISIV
jgi:hypothetical protein